MEINTKLWYLQQFDILKPLSQDEIDKLSAIAIMKTISKGQILYLPSDDARVIYFLKSGKVKISAYSKDGRELTKAILGRGELFGEMAIVDSHHRDEVVEVIEDGLICSIPEPEFRDFLINNPLLNIEITKLIGQRLIRIENKLESLYFKNAHQRVCEFLKELAIAHGNEVVPDTKFEVDLYLTHEDIAKMTASTRQTVTTILRKLEKDGVISYDRKKLHIYDLGKL